MTIVILLLYLAEVFIAAALVVYIFVLGYTLVFGAPYVPTSKRKTKLMLRLAKARRGERLVDLGSGDGTIVIEAAKLGLVAEGYEVNPYLIWKSRRNLATAKVTRKAKIYFKDMWKADVSKADIVTVYGISWIMKGLEEKLLKELPVGARVVSETFKFPNWQVVEVKDKVYLYVND